MLDLLAAIVSADPPALLAWLILAFAAAGYPLGIMLGSSCSPCCGPSNPCSLCTEGQLPDTLTVTFNGLQDQTPGPDLCLLTFSAPYGSGAAGKVTAPSGDPATDKGPITAVSLTNGGSGYAKLGRVAPTITASGGSGTGATFSVQTAKNTDANGIPSWSATGVTFTGTTSGYVDGDQITFEVAEGDTAEQGAAATIHTVRTAPTVTASASGGTGATLSVTTAPSGSTPQTWSVTGVTVTNGGTGYPASGYVTFSTASGDTTEQSAVAMFYCGRTTPTVTASVSGSSGSGASITPTLTQGQDWQGRPVWYVDGVTIDNGGSGYAVDEYVLFSSNGEGYGYGAISSVDESGAITSVYVYYGEFYKSNGVIQGIEFYPAYDGGIYYRDAGEIASISVEAGGKYYREDASQPPYVATVTVGVDQDPPSNGTGATFTATVESDTGSANFGKITGVAITNGGTNYLAWQWRNTKCCGWYWNGKPVVLKRLNYGSGDACFYEHRMCGGWSNYGAKGRVSLQYNGPSVPPSLGIITELSPEVNPAQQCNTSFSASGSVTNCSDWSGVSFSASGGATATVSAGGEYDTLYKANNSCNQCCQGEEDVPNEIEVEVTDGGYYQPNGDMSGTYVLNRIFTPGSLSWSGGRGCLDQWCGTRFFIDVAIHPGMCSSTDGCNECIKKCEIAASCRLELRPATWFYPDDVDMRYCYQYDPNLDDAEKLDAYCQAFCFPAPMCSPPSGMQFNFFRPNGSANFTSTGCPNCCEENAGRPTPYGLVFPTGNHLNTYTMTIS